MSPKDTSEAPRPPRKVLLCEDDMIVAMDLQIILEDNGYEVLGAFASVSAAKEALEDQTPDVAVLDVRLTDGEVFPVAEILEDRGVGIVFHSGHMPNEEILERFEAAKCVPKPVDPKLLIDALEKYSATADLT